MRSIPDLERLTRRTILAIFGCHEGLGRWIAKTFYVMLTNIVFLYMDLLETSRDSKTRIKCNVYVYIRVMT